ncbi:MAG TPA: hypothetical protein VHC49_08345 [Mycobacteriales bacterium]|nr:hypothetical protein [Mycobacteriales bacterium]
MTIDQAAARTFLLTHARIIEIRLAEFVLDGVTASAHAAIAGVEAYRNSDGGFGNGLEADALAPPSQPLDVDVAFDVLSGIAESTEDTGVREHAAEVAEATLGYLDAVSDSSGGLSIVFPSAAEYPRAEHWGDAVFPPALNPTAKIVANARTLGLEHPWIDRAADFCRAAVDGLKPDTDAHTALCVLPFLESDLDRESSQKAYETLLSGITQMSLFNLMPGPDYGLTPLDFASDPSSPRRKYFPAEAIDAHLDDLVARQQDDGGWTMVWNPPGPRAVNTWRGVITLGALRTLRANGRI